MKKFSEFADDGEYLTGEKIHISEIFDKEIIVTDFRMLKSKFNSDGYVMKLQFKLNDKEYVIFTNSLVLIKQCKKYKCEMPFLTTIRKVSNYYTFC